MSSIERYVERWGLRLPLHQSAVGGHLRLSLVLYQIAWTQSGDGGTCPPEVLRRHVKSAIVFSKPIDRRQRKVVDTRALNPGEAKTTSFSVSFRSPSYQSFGVGAGSSANGCGLNFKSDCRTSSGPRGTCVRDDVYCATTVPQIGYFEGWQAPQVIDLVNFRLTRIGLRVGNSGP